MRIAILTWGLSEGAFANSVSAMAKGFWDVGIREVYLIYLFAGPSRYVTIPEGVQLISLGVQHARWAAVPLARFLRKCRPDVLISMPSIINIPAILGWLLAGKGSTKLIISEHATMSYKSYIEHRADLRFRFLPWLVRLLYPQADGLHAVNQDVLEDLVTQIRIPLRPDYMRAIANPVDIDSIYNYSQADSNHPWLQRGGGSLIVSVGRLARQKNFPILLKAFAIVRQQLDLKLIIFGEGPERSRLESLVAELGLNKDVSLPGFSANPWSGMARGRVFVLPSEEEAFGLVLVEAMACGVPVVATDAIGGGPRSILENGRYGLLVPSGNSEALADAILKVMNSVDLHDRLVAAGRQRCEAFRPEWVAQQWLYFIARLS
jgi:glycosyltransferase involved in cell wall biosynthesis